MYCSNCGTEASGNFCAQCGQRLAPPALALPAAQELPRAIPLVAPLPAAGPWEREVRYDAVLALPEVRDLIAWHAASAPRGFSAEQFLELADLAFEPLVGVSVQKIASLAAPIWSRLGVRTGKSQTASLPQPTGRALVAVLCSLARRGRKVKQAHQGEDGCIIEAVLPSDMWSFEGELVVSVQRCQTAAHAPDTTEVRAATKIPGQLYDWGKSTHCLNHLFDDLVAFSVRSSAVPNLTWFPKSA